LNQRKGKIITIYDLKLKMDWTGEGGEDDKTSGTLTMEMEHDMTPDEFPVS
jgi:activator of HSP90 ATPase